MATRIFENDNKDDVSTYKDPASVPSGFVLKLYQMVNEAPDDIIAVSRFIGFISFCHFLLWENFLYRKFGRFPFA